MKENNEYKGWLTSNNFWKRSFAVYGHALVAHALVVLSVLVIALVLSLLGGVYA